MKTLDCLNFSPREAFERYAGQEMERLMAHAPSDAESRLRAFFDQDRFVVEASIVSSEGKFRASCGVPVPSNHPNGRMWQTAALDEMFGDLERQIMKWKKKRFQGDPAQDGGGAKAA